MAESLPNIPNPELFEGPVGDMLAMVTANRKLRETVDRHHSNLDPELMETIAETSKALLLGIAHVAQVAGIDHPLTVENARAVMRDEARPTDFVSLGDQDAS